MLRSYACMLKGSLLFVLAGASRWKLCLPELIRPGGLLRMQGDCAFRAGEAGKGHALPFMLSVLKKPCGAVAAELVGPDILLPCEVRKCEADICMRRPASNYLQKLAKRLGSGEQAINAGLRGGVVRGCWKDEPEVLGTHACHCGHGQSKLRECLKARNICLRIFG